MEKVKRVEALTSMERLALAPNAAPRGGAAREIGQEMLNLTYWRRLHGVRQVSVPAKLKVDRRGLPVFRVPAWTAPA